MDASYKIQRGIHVHLIQFFMCPEFWVHITLPLAAAPLFESPSSWGPQPSPTQWVGWGEEEQGSGGRDAHAWASRRERTLRRRGRRGAVPGYGRLLQSPVKRSAERPGAGAQRATQTKKQLRRSVRIYREVKDKAGRNGLPCPFYTE